MAIVDESVTNDGEAMSASLATDLARAALAVARRGSAGATMWCVAPSWPEHARHVAVEFVHPVIVGKRALAAVALVEPDPIAALRAVVRSGDVLVAIGTAGDAQIVDVLRRAPAWGLETLWIGWGPRALTSGADHTLWVDDADSRAAYDGSLMLLYHVLWELTHVCFEHPGLLRDDADSGNEVCITCSDEGRVAEVVEVNADGAIVRTADGVQWADVSLIGPVGADDLVLVHAGTAIAVLDG